LDIKVFLIINPLSRLPDSPSFTIFMVTGISVSDEFGMVDLARRVGGVSYTDFQEIRNAQRK
jgi:hypothetical protein